VSPVENVLYLYDPGFSQRIAIRLISLRAYFMLSFASPGLANTEAAAIMHETRGPMGMQSRSLRRGHRDPNTGIECVYRAAPNLV
jgi:hypothetical protein